MDLGNASVRLTTPNESHCGKTYSATFDDGHVVTADFANESGCEYFSWLATRPIAGIVVHSVDPSPENGVEPPKDKAWRYDPAVTEGTGGATPMPVDGTYATTSVDFCYFADEEPGQDDDAGTGSGKTW
jgi:hypothetical protein